MRRTEKLKECLSIDSKFFLPSEIKSILWFYKLSRQRPRHTNRILRDLNITQARELLKLIRLSSGKCWPNYVVDYLTDRVILWREFTIDDTKDLVLAC